MKTRIYITRNSPSINFQHTPMVLSIYQDYIPVVVAMWGTVVELEGKKILKYPNINMDIGSKRLVFNSRQIEYIFIKQNNANLYRNDIITAGLTYSLGLSAEEGYIAETALQLSYGKANGELLPLVCLAIKPDKLWEVRDSHKSVDNFGFCDAKDFVILVDREFRKKQHNYLWRNYNRIFKKMEASNAIDILHNVNINELCYKSIPLTEYDSLTSAIDRAEEMTNEFSEIVNPTEISYIDADVTIVDDTAIRVIDDTEPPSPESFGYTVELSDIPRLVQERNLEEWIRLWDHIRMLMVQEAGIPPYRMGVDLFRMEEQMSMDRAIQEALVDTAGRQRRGIR